MTREQTGWLAAIIDGEGTVCMAVSREKVRQRSWYVPHVAIANSDPAIIAEAQSLLDALGVRYHVSVSNKRKGHFGKKDVWAIVVHHFRSLETLLRFVGPHLKSIKRAKAELMLRWVQRRLPKVKGGRPYMPGEIQLAEELRALSRSGQLTG